jgi:hypothetical protein
MRWFAVCLVVLALPLLAAAPAQDARLDYRIKAVLRDGAVVDGAFQVLATRPLVTRNHVQRHRLGSWEIRPQAPGVAPAFLVQALNLCYFAGPTDQVAPLAEGVRFQGRWCRLWQVRTPPRLGAYAYLAEVAPGLLALAYLSAARPQADFTSLEIRLVGLSLGRAPAPAEDGLALLRTLRAWSEAPAPAETEQVP